MANTSPLTIVLAKAIFLLHLFFVVFVVFGFLLPAHMLTIHMYAIPLMLLQWWVNNNKCILTQIQHRLEGKKPDDIEDGQFVKALTEKFGFEFTEKQLFMIIYGLIALSFSVSAFRYFNS